jgi:soluble lytic murein transglycosylase-like protein
MDTARTRSNSKKWMEVLRGLALGVVWLGVSLPASADIYSWRDTNGNLVLSNTHRPPEGVESKSYPVSKTEGVHATVFVSAEKTRSYDDLIVEHAQLNGVRTDLVRAVVQVESAYNPNARSPKGAKGLMQLMPATISRFGVANPYNPVENVRAGVAYLRELLNRYRNNEELALAAYNAGPGAVDRYGENVPPYRETQNYVLRINKIAGARPAGAAPRPKPQIYKAIKIVDGREVVVYTDRKASVVASQ